MKCVISIIIIMCVVYHYRYDAELYQRIEQLIDKKLPIYPTVEGEVLSLMERVTEAKRIAIMVK